MAAPRYAVSIDVGGTFTDLALFDVTQGAVAGIHKVLTDPQRPARAVLQGWRELLELAGVEPRQVAEVVHSTTLVTNALVERRGARTALLTTQGFRDVLEIGIEQLYDIYDLFAPYPEPLVPRHWRREVRERLSRDGSVLEPLDEDSVLVQVDELVSEGVESIAVSLIHAYRNPAHERRIAELIARRYPELAVSLSSQVAPLIGEYERTATVVADAYVKPLLRRYLADLRDALEADGFTGRLFLVLSSGGVTTLEAAMDFPVRLLESGPAAGAFAASFYGRLAGHEDVLSLDMGGTTAKACLIERGAPEVVRMLEVDRVHRFKPGSGLPVMTPTVDLIEIGAGGGSIATIDRLGLLKVGPQSAGADPGPACYGRGGERPTVTDANLLLGYLDPANFLGGRMSLRPELARQAVARFIMEPLGLELGAAARGVHAIVNENMAQAARTHIIERNRDPRSLAMVAFGGAGPAHAASVARILGIRTVIVPLGAGVASAIGALTAPLAMPFTRTYMTTLEDCDWSVVCGLYQEMRAEAARALAPVAGEAALIETRAVDLRFAGQYHELRVTIPEGLELSAESRDALEAAFAARYREVYGRVPSGLGVEALNWHLTASVPRPAFRLAPEPVEARDPAPALRGERAVYFDDPAPGERRCPVYDRYRLLPGMQLAGPAIVEERETTIVVPPAWQAKVDAYRNLILERAGHEADE
uniref:Hydantoinase/oxoprolinase family protein n=1 Tax=Thermorudis peleae TaxID=1382356 RepID=A0A831X8S2_9BACT